MLSQMPKIELIRISATPALTPAHPPATPVLKPEGQAACAQARQRVCRLGERPGQRGKLLRFEGAEGVLAETVEPACRLQTARQARHALQQPQVVDISMRKAGGDVGHGTRREA